MHIESIVFVYRVHVYSMYIESIMKGKQNSSGHIVNQLLSIIEKTKYQQPLEQKQECETYGNTNVRCQSR